MPSLLNSNAGPQSNITWLQAARRVARTVGGMNDPNVLAAAKDAISEALQDWNTEKDWRFLQVIAPDIAITADVARYALPTNYKKVYDAYLINAKRQLKYLNPRTLDSIAPGGVPGGRATAYMLYNVGTTGEIEIVPASTNDTLVVRYYRPIIEIDDDEAFLDLPSRYVPGILYAARSLMCLEAKDYSGADRWETRAKRQLLWAKKDDDMIPDEDLGFVPETYYMTGANPPFDEDF